MIRPVLTVSTGTLASRLLGFARDAMVAALLGAGPVADAFLVAFQGINVIRRALTEGSLNAALVPAWLRVRDGEGAAAASIFAGRVLGSVSLAMFAAAIVIGLAMPLVITALAPGFAGSATLTLAVDNARLMLPYLAFAGPVAVMTGLLNAQHRFVLTAFSPILFNLALIGAMVALLQWRRDPADAAVIIAATVGTAGLLQLAMLAARVGGGKIAAPLRVSFDPAMRGFFLKGMAGMVANSGPQLLIMAGAIIASSSPSAVSWLYFANRLIELPLGIVGTAMGTVLVPELARAISAGDRRAVVRAESRGLELAVALALPAALGLIVLREPIVRALFEHGAFSAADSTATAQALALLALGLPAHVLGKALAPAFFARGDTATPLLAALKGFAVAIILSIVLGQICGIAGIAAGVACGAWSNALTLVRRGAKSFGFSLDTAARRRLPRIVIAALSMGGLVWLAAALLLEAAGLRGIAQTLALAAIIGGGVATYGLLLAFFGVIGRANIANSLGR
jgi:putative peptidoglycan lipid II flippase